MNSNISKLNIESLSADQSHIWNKFLDKIEKKIESLSFSNQKYFFKGIVSLTFPEHFIDAVQVFLLLTLNIFHTFFQCLYCLLTLNK